MLLAQHLPPPPEGFQPPILWGVEEHVRGLFEAAGATVSCSVERVRVEGPSVETWLDEEEQMLGPLVLAKEALEPDGAGPRFELDSPSRPPPPTRRPTARSCSSPSTCGR